MNTITVLSGHTSPDNAYVIADYPYGSLRCKKRVWIETATKGAKKGLMRVVSQTTNPKKPGEYWNKPKAGTYNRYALLYLESDTGHLKWDGLDELAWSQHISDFKTRWYDLMPSEEKEVFDSIYGEKFLAALARFENVKYTIAPSEQVRLV